MINCTNENLFASLSEEQDNSGGRLIQKTSLDKINILFVINNGSDMRDVQQAMANQFDPFLERIRDFDYQIAIITTDWVAEKGKFLTFPNKETVLSNPGKKASVHKENISLFQKTITPLQDSWTVASALGLQSINHALNISEQDDFFRPHSLFIIIIVSNDDPIGGTMMIEHYDEDYDEPETLFKRISRKHKLSAVVVHSIIPGYPSCYSPLLRRVGLPNEVYMKTSHPSSRIRKEYGNVLTGEIIHICDLNYGSQLGSIADHTIRNRLVPLECSPIDNSVSLRVNGRKTDFKLKDRNLFINQKTPFNAEAEIFYRCPTK